MFPDASAHIDGALTIQLSTTSPEYTGFKVRQRQLISPRLTSPHSIPPHLTSPRLNPPHLAPHFAIKVAFSATGIPIIAGSHTAYGTFKAPFTAAATTDVQTVTVPFSTFSYDWSPYTGECDTLDPTGVQHHCCSADDDYKYCPTADYLGSITGFEVWAEGIEGDFHIEVLEIAAADAASA